jgi:hypothetical protein
MQFTAVLLVVDVLLQIRLKFGYLINQRFLISWMQFELSLKIVAFALEPSIARTNFVSLSRLFSHFSQLILEYPKLELQVLALLAQSFACLRLPLQVTNHLRIESLQISHIGRITRADLLQLFDFQLQSLDPLLKVFLMDYRFGLLDCLLSMQLINCFLESFHISLLLI